MTASTPRLHDPDRAARQRLAAAVEPAHLGAAWAAYRAAKVAGLCHEGAWEVALGTTRLPSERPVAHRPSPV